MRVVVAAHVPVLPQMSLHGSLADSTATVVDPDAAEALEQILAIAEDADELLVLLPEWAGPSAARLVRLARAATDVPVRLAVVSLPPLACAVLAAQLAVVAATVDETGAVLAAVPVLAGDLDSIAWLGSVARLSALPTGIGQHVRSWLPGSGFVARSSGKPVVLQVSDATAVSVIEARPGRIAVTATAQRGDPSWVSATVLPGMGASSIVAARSTQASVAWWGTDRLVEVVGAAIDPVGVAAAALPARGRVCGWCGELVATTACPVCGMRISSSGEAGGPMPVAVTTVAVRDVEPSISIWSSL